MHPLGDGPPILPDELDSNARLRVRVDTDEALRRILKFVGDGITLTDDPVNEIATVTFGALGTRTVEYGPWGLDSLSGTATDTTMLLGGY